MGKPAFVWAHGLPAFRSRVGSVVAPDPGLRARFPFPRVWWAVLWRLPRAGGGIKYIPAGPFHKGLGGPGPKGPCTTG